MVSDVGKHIEDVPSGGMIYPRYEIDGLWVLGDFRIKDFSEIRRLSQESLNDDEVLVQIAWSSPEQKQVIVATQYGDSPVHGTPPLGGHGRNFLFQREKGGWRLTSISHWVS
jgi:hypothetical protein